MKTVTKNCLNCNKKFEAPLREINRGNGKYCSISCSSIYTKSLLIKPQFNCVCAYCNKQFYKSKSKLKISKSGLYFCSRKCKDIAQRVENNFKEIQPKHYRTGESNYREIAFRYYPKICNRCKYSKYIDILEVHHKDRNRENNILSNLEILCPNCHTEEHFLSRERKEEF